MFACPRRHVRIEGCAMIRGLSELLVADHGRAHDRMARAERPVQMARRIRSGAARASALGTWDLPHRAFSPPCMILHNIKKGLAVWRPERIGGGLDGGVG